MPDETRFVVEITVHTNLSQINRILKGPGLIEAVV